MAAMPKHQLIYTANKRLFNNNINPFTGNKIFKHLRLKYYNLVKNV